MYGRSRGVAAEVAVVVSESESERGKKEKEEEGRIPLQNAEKTIGC